jgi:hypothetical protein
VPALARLYGIRPSDVSGLRGTELDLLAEDIKQQYQREQLQEETLLRLSVWLEAQGG